MRGFKIHFEGWQVLIPVAFIFAIGVAVGFNLR